MFSSYVIALYKNDFDEQPLNFGYLTLHKKSRQKCLSSKTIHLRTNSLRVFLASLNFEAVCIFSGCFLLINRFEIELKNIYHNSKIIENE